ncbi:hypothetical protein GGR32_001491 [Mesonia hippocampi]|uniref:DUF6787 domain-containing protein n=1 Tax=Mesonia hippocampi TaxID=1628250 RepID=A0A840EQ41_9FLAO|nr:DUF6787 family protein [Mesonia hippocampi]MBB4119195.1 hypothetical protein [Mesonia hippocampi]
MKKLKERWNISSNFQLTIIFIVFAITGSLSAYLGKPVLAFFNINGELFGDSFLGKTLYLILRLLIIFPIYQVLLVFIGFLFGQFKFFWNFEKKMLKRLGLGFLFK